MHENLNNDELIALAREVLEIESRAVDSLRERLDDDFAAACKLIDDTPGRVVVPRNPIWYDALGRMRCSSAAWVNCVAAS